MICTEWCCAMNNKASFKCLGAALFVFYLLWGIFHNNFSSFVVSKLFNPYLVNVENMVRS